MNRFFCRESQFFDQTPWNESPESWIAFFFPQAIHHFVNRLCISTGCLCKCWRFTAKWIGFWRESIHTWRDSFQLSGTTTQFIVSWIGFMNCNSQYHWTWRESTHAVNRLFWVLFPMMTDFHVNRFMRWMSRFIHYSIHDSRFTNSIHVSFGSEMSCVIFRESTHKWIGSQSLFGHFRAEMKRFTALMNRFI